MIEAKKEDIVKLLKNTQRMAVINGKLMPQVQGCIIWPVNDTTVHTVSLVRDGITSVARMTGDVVQAKEEVVVPDIEKLLGALKAHSGLVKIAQTDEKLRIKSVRKQTTLTASRDALAFPHTTLTIAEWDAKSRELMNKISTNGYRLQDGTLVQYYQEVMLTPTGLADAINAGNINGQKVARYSFTQDGFGLHLRVGDAMKGESVSQIAEQSDLIYADRSFEMVCEGGLENLDLGEVNLYVLDFQEQGQGFHLVLEGQRGMVYQRGIV
tara:strand:+ start:1428 stop:2231 length:804 start_codon:yes stop_codon:yes gene_type:complete